nr:hypothetical protein [Parashewanella hymeniacidonis]
MAITQESNTLAVLDSSEPLSRTLVRQLGNDALLDRRDHDPAAGRERSGTTGGQDQSSDLWQEEPQVCADRFESQSLRGKQRLSSDKGVLNDRTGNPFVERIKAFGERVQQATERLRTITTSFARDVQSYLGSKQQTSLGSEMLERSNQQVKQIIDQRQKTIKLNNESERGHGFSR